jgi:hypothetical protein
MAKEKPSVESLDLLDRQSPIRTGAAGFAGALVVFGVESIAFLTGSTLLFGASFFVLRLAVPMLLVWFFSGCRCGDGPFYLTTGGLMGAIGALIGAGVSLLVQSFALGGSPTAAGYFLTMGFYVLLTGLGAFSLSSRYHSQSREIVWGEEYGSEVGRTAVEKFMARAKPAASGEAKKKPSADK